MKITAITIMALTGMAPHAAGARAERSVTVCLESGPFAGVLQARSVASEIFAAIGVTIIWRQGLPGGPSNTIIVSLDGATPADLMPGSLAYALPYEGTHIRVFYDRIAETHYEREIPRVLGHVLAHEITHIVQGVSRHSATGVMKARWGQRDFDRMDWKLLEFTAEDVDLIYRGLAARIRRIAAVNTPPAAIAGRPPQVYD